MSSPQRGAEDKWEEAANIPRVDHGYKFDWSELEAGRQNLLRQAMISQTNAIWGTEKSGPYQETNP